MERRGWSALIDISCMSFLPSPLARSRPYSDIAAPYSWGIGVMCAANTHHFLLSHCSHPKNEVRTIQVISPNETFFVGLLSPSPYDSTVLNRPFQAFLQLWWTKLFCCHRKVGSWVACFGRIRNCSQQVRPAPAVWYSSSTLSQSEQSQRGLPPSSFR